MVTRCGCMVIELTTQCPGEWPNIDRRVAKNFAVENGMFTETIIIPITYRSSTRATQASTSQPIIFAMCKSYE